MKKTLSIFSLLGVLLSPATTALPADWPTYLENNERTGSTSQQLQLPLTEAWVFSSPSPLRRAWAGPTGRTIEGKELRDRVKYDDALQVAAVDGRVFFGSSVDHRVRCLDIATGEELWHFFTGAPIRLAPRRRGCRRFGCRLYSGCV